MIYNLTKENVKIVGRTFIHQGILWCGLSGSGIGFSFIGTKATITLAGDNSTQGFVTEGQARVGIYVNGQRVVDTIMDMEEKTFTVFQSQTTQETVVEIVKLSECAMSTFGIKSIDVESVNGITPLPEKARKIEFIGDSITCGYGVDLEVPESEFLTSTEDCTKAFAYKTAKNLEADYSLVSFSGYGILSGYTENNEKALEKLVPTYYEKIGFSYAKPEGTLALEDISWDFQKFVPHLIVINLGTNDDSFCQDSLERQQEFTEAYIPFLQRIRSLNPDSTILSTVGIMGQRIFPAVKNAVCEYQKLSGDQNIYEMMFTEQLPEDGLVTHWHPTAVTHTKAAAEITKKIQEIMNW